MRPSFAGMFFSDLGRRSVCPFLGLRVSTLAEGEVTSALWDNIDSRADWAAKTSSAAFILGISSGMEDPALELSPPIETLF